MGREYRKVFFILETQILQDKQGLFTMLVSIIICRDVLWYIVVAAHLTYSSD